MGVIVSDKTYVKCDIIGCENRSEGSYDQQKAYDDAIKSGWFISQNTGFSECPKCRGW